MEHNIENELKECAAILRDEDFQKRHDAVYRLRSMPSDASLALLLNAVCDPDELVRAEVIIALGDYPLSIEAVQAVIAALHDVDADNRVTAASTLGWMKNPLAIKPLLDALQHGNERIREEAVNSLGEFQLMELIEPLAHIMKTDSSLEARQSAAHALANISIGDAAVNKAAYHILVETAENNPHPDIRLVAEQALRES
ncbi:MAG: HEAT repeat domain-containing protein [Armatimonadota bacterium]